MSRYQSPDPAAPLPAQPVIADRGAPGSEVARLHWAPRAWLAGRWQDGVVLEVGEDGRFAAVRSGANQPDGALALPGPVLPALVDAHSHAFQRAFAGLAERRPSAHDDFWSWRDRMYEVALRISPDALEAVAAQLYAELLEGGYTQVCEFHYLQHAPDGRRYADAPATSRALARAARTAGIGLTLLPVLYERAGFDRPALRDDQRRFAASVDDVLALRDAVRALDLPRVAAGTAIHSLRAAAPESIARLERALAGDPAPIHVHVAEQTAEVEACLSATGCRPIEWLARHVPIDARWQLVHATHATHAEIEAVARAGAGIVICPSTEANLGDGLPDLAGWLDRAVPVSIGSDSQVGRAWPHELRLLEYGQRLALRRRNVAADPDRGAPVTAARLFDRVLDGGGRAAGFERWGLKAGAPADWLVLDPRRPGLLGVPASHALDALVFATDGPVFAEVWVGGRRRVSAGRHVMAEELGATFADAMNGLWPADRVAPG